MATQTSLLSIYFLFIYSFVTNGEKSPLVLTSQDTKPCCMTEGQVAFNMSMTIGVHLKGSASSVSRMNGTLYIDSKKNMEKQVYSNGEIRYYMYSEKVGYLYYTGNKTCVNIATDSPSLIRCVPEDAKYGGPARFSVGTESLTAHFWEYDFKSPAYSGHFYLAVTEDQCLPMFAATYGTAVMESLIYDGFIFDVSSSVFDLPAACKSVPSNANFNLAPRYRGLF